MQGEKIDVAYYRLSLADGDAVSYTHLLPSII